MSFKATILNYWSKRQWVFFDVPKDGPDDRTWDRGLVIQVRSISKFNNFMLKGVSVISLSHSEIIYSYLVRCIYINFFFQIMHNFLHVSCSCRTQKVCILKEHYIFGQNYEGSRLRVWPSAENFYEKFCEKLWFRGRQRAWTSYLLKTGWNKKYTYKIWKGIMDDFLVMYSG